MSYVDCLSLAFEVTFIAFLVISAKALFEESVVLDRITAMLILFRTGLGGGLTFLNNQFPWKGWEIAGLGSTIILLYIFFRGDRKRLIYRIRAMIDVGLSFFLSTFINSVIIVALTNPKQIVDDTFLFQDAQIIILFCLLIFVFSILMYKELVHKGIYLNCNFVERLFLSCIGIGSVIVGEMLIKAVGDMVKTGTEIPDEISIILIGFSLFFYIGMPVLFVKNKVSNFYKMGQKYQEEINTLELKHFEQYKLSQDETNRFRHDMINNLMAVQMLQKDGKAKAAEEYVNELLGRIQSLSPKVVTGCDLLDCIITSKLEMMELKKIEFVADGVMDYGLEMSPVDICTIFANALDNAIEACEQCEENRYIHMRIKRTSAFYCIVLENSMKTQEKAFDVAISMTKSADTKKKTNSAQTAHLSKTDSAQTAYTSKTDSEQTAYMPKNNKISKKSRYTTKQNKELHGYGLGNIIRTVKKYNGDTSLESGDRKFILTIMLPVGKKSGED